jgi:hypothetical protein
MSGLSQSDNPPHAEDHGLGFLQRLAAEGTSFPGYRVSTTSAQAAMVSMLSGTSPWVHQMSEDERSWPRTVPRLAEIVEAHAGQTAMFSGVPHSFAPFGFAQGFEVFEQISPVADLAAVEPARRARAWLGARLNDRGPLLTVLHLRGGHPPFDVNHDTALELPPAEYGGDLDPRRAAIQLLSIRSRTRAAGRVMPEEDWIRLAALRKRALLDQSAVLAQLFGMLREGNAWDDSLIIVVGDAASGLRPAIPFDEHAPLSEELLSVPLLVKFPHKYLAGRPVAGNFSPRDVFATLAQGLGLEVPAETIPLGSARAEHDARGRAHVAFRDGHFVARLGPYLLSGQNGRVPKLCRVDLDPACSLDRYLDEPLPVRVLWLETHRALADTASSSAETFEPGEELAAALTVWGATR